MSDFDFSKYNLTPSAKTALADTIPLSQSYNHKKIIDIHLVYCIINEQNINIDTVLENHGLLKEGILSALSRVLEAYKEPRRKKDIFAPEIFDILDEAIKVSRKSKHDFVGTDHILIAILTIREEIIGFFKALQIDVDKIISDIEDCHLNGIESLRKPEVPSPTAPTSQSKETINDWCENINEKILKRDDFEVFGRENEINRCFEILLKRNKSNVILVGEAGVGKTAIVDGIAERIIKRECPEFLVNREILSLTTSSLVAGSMYRGQMEEKVKKILKLLQTNKQYILFIDEIHTIIGAGNSEGGLDIANILKPALSRGDISVIGATTKEEYNRFFDKDSALKRRFERVIVNEPTKEECLSLLEKVKLSYENFHMVSYKKSDIELIIDLCDKYEPKKKFPDKAIDILDEAGCKTKIKHTKRPLKAIELEEKLMDENLLKNKKKYKSIEKEYKTILEEWGKTLEDKKFKVSTDTIYSIFAQKLEIDVDSIKNQVNINVEGRIGFGV